MQDNSKCASLIRAWAHQLQKNQFDQIQSVFKFQELNRHYLDDNKAIPISVLTDINSLPSIAQIISKTDRIVVHIPYSTSQVSLACVLVAQQMGAVVIISSSPRQTRQHSIFAYLASCAFSVVHFYRSGDDQIPEHIEDLDITQVSNYILTHPEQIPFDNIMADSEKLIGSTIKSFEFVGKPSNNVIITLGAFPVDEQHFTSSIQVNIFNPWKRSDFIDLFPANTESILLVEDMSLACTWNPLYLSVVDTIVSSCFEPKPAVSFWDTSSLDLKFEELLVPSDEKTSCSHTKYFLNLLRSILGDKLRHYYDFNGTAETALGIVPFLNLIISIGLGRYKIRRIFRESTKN